MGGHWERIAPVDGRSRERLAGQDRRRIERNERWRSLCQVQDAAQKTVFLRVVVCRTACLPLRERIPAPGPVAARSAAP